MIKRIINRIKARREEKRIQDRERLIKDLEKRLNEYKSNLKK